MPVHTGDAAPRSLPTWPDADACDERAPGRCGAYMPESRTISAGRMSLGSGRSVRSALRNGSVVVFRSGRERPGKGDSVAAPVVVGRSGSLPPSDRRWGGGLLRFRIGSRKVAAAAFGPAGWGGGSLRLSDQRRFSSRSFWSSYMRSRNFAAARKSSDLAARSMS